MRTTRQLVTMGLLAGALFGTTAAIARDVASSPEPVPPEVSVLGSVTWREGDVRFKVTCGYSHSLRDDPIVYPGQPGAAHLHDFTGNRSVNANVDTYTELTAPGVRTTCNDPGDLAGYWTPDATVNGRPEEVDSMTGYYRRGGKIGTIRPYPDGLKIVAESGLTGWQCDGTPVPKPTPDGCTTNVTMRIEFPDCLAVDPAGKPLTDSADHRSHMAYASGGDGRTVPNVCPSSHPYLVPELQTYVHLGDIPAGATVVLSSGDPNSLHGDFFNGWQTARLSERVATCLNGYQRCDSGG